MRDKQHKLSKRYGDANFEDFLEKGFLPEAILNYVALLGWNPKNDREKFTLSELVEAFDIAGISKSPSIFDKVKLRYFNTEYIRKLTEPEFAAAAKPWIERAAKGSGAAIDENKVAALIQSRCETLADIPQMISFLYRMPEYETELYTHKKSKTDAAISLSVLKKALPVIESLNEWSRDALYNAQVALAESMDAKNALVMYPLRIAVSGLAVTPGGAAEICDIIGRVETIARIKSAILKLESAQ